MTRKEAKAAETAENLEQLRAWLPAGSTVYCILRHVARSGMYRRISLLVTDKANPERLIQLDYRAALALNIKLSDKEGVPVSGCGMDMGFHLVYSLSRVLYPEGHGCTGPNCPSNDHSNGDRDYTVHTGGNSLWRPGDVTELCGFKVKPSEGIHWHRDGGYALRCSWL